MRNRVWIILATLGVIALGLASRRLPFLFPAVLGKYPGDALWTVTAYLGWALVWPRASIVRLALFALSTSYAVEISQLYQAPWINSIRATATGHLVLGSTFAWMDMVAYTVGAGLGMVLDYFCLSRVRN